MNVWIGAAASALISLTILISLWRISVVVIERTPRKPQRLIESAPPKQLEAKADDAT